MSSSEASNNWVAVSFGSGNSWSGARARLFNQLSQFSFGAVEILDESWIESSDLMPSATKIFVKEHSKGFGYWIWKPYLVKYILLKYPECDGVFYLDVGCEFNVNTQSSSRFKGYMQTAINRGSFAFELSEPDLYWTSTLVIEELNAEKLAESNQISATTFLLKNSDSNIDFINEWIDLCSKKNFTLLMEEKSVNPNFKKHRHDQSIFSLLWKRKNYYSCPDESYWAPNWVTRGINYPIWATRNRLSISIKSPTILKLALKVIRRTRQALGTILLKPSKSINQKFKLNGKSKFIFLQSKGKKNVGN